MYLSWQEEVLRNAWDTAEAFVAISRARDASRVNGEQNQLAFEEAEQRLDRWRRYDRFRRFHHWLMHRRPAPARPPNVVTRDIRG